MSHIFSPVIGIFTLVTIFTMQDCSALEADAGICSSFTLTQMPGEMLAGTDIHPLPSTSQKPIDEGNYYSDIGGAEVWLTISKSSGLHYQVEITYIESGIPAEHYRSLDLCKSKNTLQSKEILIKATTDGILLISDLNKTPFLPEGIWLYLIPKPVSKRLI
ncbi:hypothetical protein [Oceanobacter mangrovi]|uniref:hypothetical protein n=1 Tax=Oceanobacter mangrovi TaxID=2862510 RepID=UPI001C8E2700|nr:hypothetical protein [Oceanobacter mangrovi]